MAQESAPPSLPRGEQDCHIFPKAGAPALSTGALSFPTTSPTMVWPRHSTCQPLKGLLGYHRLTHLTGTSTPGASSGLPPRGRAGPWAHQPLNRSYCLTFSSVLGRGVWPHPLPPATKAVSRTPDWPVPLSSFKVLSPLPLLSHMGNSPLSLHFLLGHVVHYHHSQWPRCPRMPHVRPNQDLLSARLFPGLQTCPPFPSPSLSRGLGATRSISTFSCPRPTGHQLPALTQALLLSLQPPLDQDLKVSLRTCHLTFSLSPLTPGT